MRACDGTDHLASCRLYALRLTGTLAHRELRPRLSPDWLSDMLPATNAKLDEYF